MALGLTNVTQTAEKVEQNSPEEIALSFFKIGQRESGCYGLNCVPPKKSYIEALPLPVSPPKDFRM